MRIIAGEGTLIVYSSIKKLNSSKQGIPQEIFNHAYLIKLLVFFKKEKTTKERPMFRRKCWFLFLTEQFRLEFRPPAICCRTVISKDQSYYRHGVWRQRALVGLSGRGGPGGETSTYNRRQITRRLWLSHLGGGDFAVSRP